MTECVRIVHHYCDNPRKCPVRLVDRIPLSHGGDAGSVPAQGTNRCYVAYRDMRWYACCENRPCTRWPK